MIWAVLGGVTVIILLCLIAEKLETIRAQLAVIAERLRTK